MIYSAVARTAFINSHLCGACRVHWSNRIVDEAFTNLARNRGDGEKFERVRSLMLWALPHAAVDALDLPDEIVLPDRHDAHVVGTAIACGATQIATFNLRHFPSRTLRPLGIHATHPDVVLATLLAQAPDTADSVREAILRERRVTGSELGTALVRARMRRTALALGLPVK